MKFIGSILSSTGSNTFEYDSRCFHSRYSDADRERRIRKPPGGPAKAFFINSSGTHVTLSNVVGFSRRTHGGDTRTAPGFPARLTHVSLLVAYLPDNADSLNGNVVASQPNGEGAGRSVIICLYAGCHGRQKRYGHIQGFFYRYHTVLLTDAGFS